jgi:hypothetical protein
MSILIARQTVLKTRMHLDPTKSEVAEFLLGQRI